MFKGIKQLFSGKKSATSPSGYMAFANYLALAGWSNLSAYQSIQYYMQCSPLFDAIDKITTEASNVRLFMFNLFSEKFEKKHPLLDLLRHPNTDMGSHEFLEQVLGYYLITGNCYIMATGQPNRPPLELIVAPPQFMSTVPNAKDGYPETYNYSSNSVALTFTREEVEGQFRYYTADKSQELYHIRKFNPLRSTSVNYGLSPLTPLYYEIEQYIKANVYNLSLLARGGRPSGAMTTDQVLSDEAFSQLQQQMDLFNAGAENSGRMLLLSSGVSYQEMGLSPRDMDFEKLKQHLTTQIYNVYHIPLALISEQSMTYNNLETAKLSLYDFAVLPLLSRVLEELSNFLMYRYKQQGKLELSYNTNSIPALQLRHNENLKAVKELGVNSINEIRAMRGDEPVMGGNDIYSNQMFPVARTAPRTAQEEAELNNAADTEIQEPEADTDKGRRIDYYQMMQKRKTREGLPVFSDDELKELARKYGLDSA